MSRTVAKTPKKVGPSYFDEIDSPEKSYILGFLLADGSVSKYAWTAWNTSREVIDYIHEITGGSVYEIDKSYMGPQCKMQYCLKVCSLSHTRALERLGLTHDKSYTGKWPVINRVLEKHFLRGFIDGDGCIGRDRIALSAASGSLSLLEGFAQALGRITGKVPAVTIFSVKKSHLFCVQINQIETAKVLREVYSEGWGLKTKSAWVAIKRSVSSLSESGRKAWETRRERGLSGSDMMKRAWVSRRLRAVA